MDRLTQLREKLRRVAQDPDVDDKKGTQPKKYYKGVDKDQKSARDAHFKKGASMDDDNPNAYKPAPGDADAKTKPSKHTNKYKKMFGDEVENEACWDGYKQVGMKKKGNKMVPDCVPEDTLPNPEDSKYYVEEGKLVTGVDSVLSVIVKKLKSEMGRRYKKNPKDGMNFINHLASMVGMTASDKSQQKGKMFLRMDMNEAVDVKKALSKVKGLTKKQVQVLSTLPTPVLTTMINQLSTLVMSEKLDKNADAGDYIDDFRKSDAPQFKGKSDKKIRKMAIAAYLDNKDKK